MVRMALCFFCHRDATLTREHLFSVPMARLAGMDRSNDVMAGLDGDGTLDHPPRTVDKWTVRVPCDLCNSGWMGGLEAETAAVLSRWIRSRKRLGTGAFKTVGRWLLKTYFIMAFQDAGLRRPLEHGADGVLRYTAKVPFEATRARHLKDASDEAFDRVTFGFARVQSETMILTGFGNPSVTTNAADWNCRTAGVAAVALPRIQLQLWVVVAPIGPESVRLPPSVRTLSPSSLVSGAQLADSRLAPTRVILTY